MPHAGCWQSIIHRYLVEVLALFLERRGLLLPLVDALVVAVALPAELSDLGAGGEHLDHRCGHEILQFLQCIKQTSCEYIHHL